VLTVQQEAARPRISPLWTRYWRLRRRRRENRRSNPVTSQAKLLNCGAEEDRLRGGEARKREKERYKDRVLGGVFFLFSSVGVVVRHPRVRGCFDSARQGDDTSARISIRLFDDFLRFREPKRIMECSKKSGVTLIFSRA
jgi:hypothetical protein